MEIRCLLGKKKLLILQNNLKEENRNPKNKCNQLMKDKNKLINKNKERIISCDNMEEECNQLMKEKNKLINKNTE